MFVLVRLPASESINIRNVGLRIIEVSSKRLHPIKGFILLTLLGKVIQLLTFLLR